MNLQMLTNSNILPLHDFVDQRVFAAIQTTLQTGALLLQSSNNTVYTVYAV